MKLLKLPIAFIAILALVVDAAPSKTAAQDKVPVAYFLDQLPDAAVEPGNLPGNAKDVIVAKVRLQERVIWLGGRDQSGEPPKDIGNDIFFVRVKITETRRGDAEPGQVLDVRLGQRSEGRRFIYPSTPDQRGREYTAVMYLAEDGKRRLAAFPISELQYSQWSTEVSNYERLRAKPGVRD